MDRNVNPYKLTMIFGKSLSARRAWIEILHTLADGFGVMSLSARRAWIEIYNIPPDSVLIIGRSPQGERG